MSDEQNRYEGEVYFIVPGEDALIINDTHALIQLNKLHERKKIDRVYFKFREDFPAVNSYCHNKGIKIGRVEDNANLVEEVQRYYGDRSEISAYVTRLETRKTLDSALRELAGEGYFVEILDN